MSDNLVERLSDEAEFSKQVGVPRIAKLLDEARAAIERQSAAPQPQPVQEPAMIYHGRCTIDCGEHGHQDVEMLKMIPAGSKLYTSPQAQPLSDADVQQISRALHQHGLTLVRTVQGFGVMKLGEITAYAATKGTT